MPFYVPLGPRGLIFQLGSLITGLVGSWVYWRDSRRRTMVPIPLVIPATGSEK